MALNRGDRKVAVLAMKRDTKVEREKQTVSRNNTLPHWSGAIKPVLFKHPLTPMSVNIFR
jgi:hypothetical protein